MKIYIKCVLLSLILASCNEKKDSVKPVQMIANYNSSIEKAKLEGRDWVKSPVSIVEKLAGSEFACEKTVITVKKLNQGEVANKVEVSIHEEGQISDDPSDYEQVFILEKNNESWRFIE
jgi:hypothetical protein